MKKIFILPLILLATAFLSSCELLEDLLPDNVTERTRTYTAFLSGNQEVPAVAASGAGQAIFTLNKEKTELAYKLIVANTDKIIFAHIHIGPAGINGPIIVPLLETQNPSGLINGVLTEGIIKADDLTGLMAGKPLSDLVKLLETGNAYTNIHSEDFPAGELRGQIGKAAIIPTYKFDSKLSGGEEVPPVTTDATGDATYTFNSDATKLNFKVKLANIEDVKFAHIHLAPKGVNGGVVITLKHDRVDGPVNGDYAEGTVTADDLSGNLKGGPLSILKAAMESGNTYTNVHSDAYPAGEVRGQIK